MTSPIGDVALSREQMSDIITRNNEELNSASEQMLSAAVAMTRATRTIQDLQEQLDESRSENNRLIQEMSRTVVHITDRQRRAHETALRAQRNSSFSIASTVLAIGGTVLTVVCGIFAIAAASGLFAAFKEINK